MTLHAQSGLWLRLLLTAAALAFAQSAPAQPVPAPAVRIGYVDMKRLLDNAPQVVTGRRKLERSSPPATPR